MGFPNSTKPYLAPQAEVIVFQLESNFMDSTTTSTTSFSSSFSLGDSSLGNGGDI